MTHRQRTYVYTPPALTPQQERVWGFIKHYQWMHGRFPQPREIADQMGWRSESAVGIVLTAISAAGHIRRPGGRLRRGVGWEIAPLGEIQ